MNTRPTTGVIQVRIDLKIVAALAVYSEGKVTRGSRSNLIRWLLESFHDALVQLGEVTPIESTSSAYSELVRLGYENARPGSQSLVVKQKFQQELSAESLRTIPSYKDVSPSEESKQLFDETD